MPFIRTPVIRHALAAAFLSSLATACGAHDTWFQRLPSDAPGEIALALGTGNRFPRHEFTVGAASLQQSGCRASPGPGQPVSLQALQDTPQALILRARIPRDGAVSCWAQQQAFEVEIAPAIVPVYFRDIHATQAVRDAWADMQARGVKWKERYTKHARIELAGTQTPSTPAQPTGMGMDVVLTSGLHTLHPGDPLQWQVLRDGQPLPDLAVELRSDLSPIGFWQQTDAQGRVSFAPPVAGHWVLRGTDLRLSAKLPDTWESRFVTLAFEVLPASP
jgi:hypothetical protein